MIFYKNLRFKLLINTKKNLKIYIKNNLKLIANYLTFLKIKSEFKKYFFYNFFKKINV